MSYLDWLKSVDLRKLEEQQEMNEIKKAIKQFKRWEECGWRNSEVPNTYMLILAKQALEKQLNGGWILFKTEYDEDYNTDMLQGEIPDDEQEILVTDGESVWSDTFMKDGMECYLDSGDDLITKVKAWRPLPKPYKESE